MKGHTDNVSRWKNVQGSNSKKEAGRILDKENAVREMKNAFCIFMNSFYETQRGNN